MLLLFSAVSGLLTVFCQCCHDNAKTSIIKNVDLVLAEGTFAIQKTDSVKSTGMVGSEMSIPEYTGLNIIWENMISGYFMATCGYGSWLRVSTDSEFYL